MKESPWRWRLVHHNKTRTTTKTVHRETTSSHDCSTTVTSNYTQHKCSRACDADVTADVEFWGMGWLVLVKLTHYYLQGALWSLKDGLELSYLEPDCETILPKKLQLITSHEGKWLCSINVQHRCLTSTASYWIKSNLDCINTNVMISANIKLSRLYQTFYTPTEPVPFLCNVPCCELQTMNKVNWIENQSVTTLKAGVSKSSPRAPLA